MSWEPAFPLTLSDVDVSSGQKVDKKIFAERRALGLVASLVDITSISKTQLEDFLRLVEPRHYADLEEERYLAGMCAYPICGNPRVDDKAKGRYKINLREKKVYDITKRKHFCSSFCYRASLHVADQVPVDACWDRREDFRLDNFTLLTKDVSTGDSSRSDSGKMAAGQDRGPQSSFARSAQLASYFGQLTIGEGLDSDDDPNPDSASSQSEDSDEDTSDMPSSNSHSQFQKTVVLPLSALASNSAAKPVLASFKKMKLCVRDWVSVCETLKQWKTTKTVELFRYKKVNYEHGQSQDNSNESIENAIIKVDNNIDEDGISTVKRKDQVVSEEQQQYEKKVFAFFAGDRRVRFAENTQVKNEEFEESAEVILPSIDSLDQKNIRENLAIERLTGSCLRCFNLLIQNQALYADKELAGVVDFVVFINDMSNVKATFRRLLSTFDLTPQNTALLPTEWTIASLVLFGASCQTGLLDLSQSSLVFDSDAEVFFYDCCKLLFTWFPRSNEIQTFIEKYTKQF